MYIRSFLTQAVLVFNGDLTIAPEKALRAIIDGKGDNAIEALAKDGWYEVHPGGY
jgi:hypothetical protein